MYSLSREFRKLSIHIVLFALIFQTVFVSSKRQIWANDSSEITGKVYEFGKDEHYPYSENKDFELSNNGNTYGKMYLQGNYEKEEDYKGKSHYVITQGNASFCYAYNDELLETDETEWHLVEDSTKTIDSYKCKDEIKKGVLIIETSKDGINWLVEEELTNVFKVTPTQDRSASLYETNDIQLLNGCHYRIIVGYKLGRKIGESKTLGLFTKDKYEYVKKLEVYEFFLSNRDWTLEEEKGSRHRIDVKKVNTGKDNGYSEKKNVDADDPHYGWDIGDFYVRGFTAQTIDPETGTLVFLKNNGDRVTLGFQLKQDINALNGKSNLCINDDINGYDQYFETPKTNTGKGNLIVRFTDYQKIPTDPLIYTNYLEANTVLNADTKIQMFEEGDYEVALDYEIKKKSGSALKKDSYTNYRIYFKFSVRNSNAMFFLKDKKTGGDLSNTDITEEGFVLDLAGSHYLTVNVKQEIWNEGVDGLVQDVQFNRSAQDGDEFTDEGIYTITVSNPYVSDPTVKKVYVGTNDVLKASVINDKDVEEVNEIVQMGGSINEDGTINYPSPAEEEQASEEENEHDAIVDSEEANSDISEASSDESDDKEKSAEESEDMKRDDKSNNKNEEQTTRLSSAHYYPVIIVILLLIIIVLLVKRRKK